MKRRNVARAGALKCEAENIDTSTRWMCLDGSWPIYLPNSVNPIEVNVLSTSSLSIYFPLCDDPSFCMTDWLIVWLFLYSTPPLDYWQSSLCLALIARLPSEVVSCCQVYRKLEIRSRRLILTACSDCVHQLRKEVRAGLTYKIAAVDKSACWQNVFVERLHWAVRGGAPRAGGAPEEDLGLTWLQTHIQKKVNTCTSKSKVVRGQRISPEKS